jgi:hypothetical protein
MTAPSRLPSLSHPKPAARPRRVKRGIVAGYIHDISQRHAPERITPATAVPSTPVPAAAALEPHQA